MKLHCFFLMLIGMAVTANVWAYGSSSSTRSCTKPKFSQFMPADKSEVAAQSAFSFVASAATYPESIEVTVKQQAVKINIVKTKAFYQVTGHLPSTLHNTYARISIKAEGPSQCQGSDGWLVKIVD
ncbi:MAG: hypothetical protein CVV13_05715 [Gammaproteobacteria bacterium HGW-Gammaproteobacteria-3]|jgi:hypothetical protein|nr:MAG: hypothetical protein CVV13_05715 [Gammaproteobacteria bacterium HGW-Gammaproteobacteria-3]